MTKKQWEEEERTVEAEPVVLGALEAGSELVHVRLVAAQTKMLRWFAPEKVETLRQALPVA